MNPLNIDICPIELFLVRALPLRQNRANLQTTFERENAPQNTAFIILIGTKTNIGHKSRFYIGYPPNQP